MSSHYVYVSCPVPECPTFASMYTGDEVLEGFQNDQWEQETILVPCDEHIGWTAPPADLTTHDAEQQAKALREAADRFGPGQLTGMFLNREDYTREWLRARAAEIEGSFEEGAGDE